MVVVVVVVVVVVEVVVVTTVVSANVVSASVDTDSVTGWVVVSRPIAVVSVVGGNVGVTKWRNCDTQMRGIWPVRSTVVRRLSHSPSVYMQTFHTREPHGQFQPNLTQIIFGKIYTHLFKPSRKITSTGLVATDLSTKHSLLTSKLQRRISCNTFDYFFFMKMQFKK